MKILVIGSTGGTGRALVKELITRGHDVTAFTRRADAFANESPRLTTFVGDATKRSDLRRAALGQDAVAVTLGIRENPLIVRLFGSARTPLTVRSLGTENTIAAMRDQGVEKLVVQSTYGIGATEGRLPLKWKLIFSLLLRPQIADSEKQERIVRDSGLDWTLVQPVGLDDGDGEESTLVSAEGDMGQLHISRKAVARVLADTLESSKYQRASIAVSAAA